MRVHAKPRLLDWTTRSQGVWTQFEDLDFKDVYVWPLLPKAVLCMAIGVLSFLALWQFYLSGLQADVAAEKAAEVALRAEFEKKLSQATNLDDLKKQREQVQQYVAQLEKQLPSKSEMSALLSDINQVGLGRSLQFELFKPGTEAVKDYHAELPISLRVSGRFHDMGRFVADIAHLPRIVTLNNISIEPQNAEGVLVLEATAKTYRYLDTEEAKAKQQNVQAAKGAVR